MRARRRPADDGVFPNDEPRNATGATAGCDPAHLGGGDTHDRHHRPVHGAYAESSGWNDVIAPLQTQSHRVIA
jgi:hypothetical protein